MTTAQTIQAIRGLRAVRAGLMDRLIDAHSSAYPQAACGSSVKSTGGSSRVEVCALRCLDISLRLCEVDRELARLSWTLADVINAIPDKDECEALRLRYLDGLTVGKAAMRAGVDRSTMFRRIRRAAGRWLS